MIDIIAKRIKILSNIVIITSGIIIVTYAFYRAKLGYLGLISGAKGYDRFLIESIGYFVIGLSSLALLKSVVDAIIIILKRET